MLRRNVLSSAWPAGMIAVLLVVLSVLGAAPKKKSGGGASAASKVKRGEYLTTIMSCVDCHTPGAFWGAPDFSRHLSGSEMGWKGPWGVTYGRNLTPDKATGIGNYTEDDIVKTLRTGVRPNGTGLNPPMSWQNYVHLTDEDAYAIAAYLKSLPPVKHQVPDRLIAGQPVAGSIIEIPPPSDWDGPREATSVEKK